MTQNILLSIEGQSNFLFSTYTAQSTSLYTADYTIPTNTDTNSNCGWYTLSNLLLEQNGLEATYFTNRWFAGEFYEVRVDP